MPMAQGTVASDGRVLPRSAARTPLKTSGAGNAQILRVGDSLRYPAHAGAFRARGKFGKNVDDAALSMLPSFPALKELMPMDVSDQGFRHVGHCEQLERLVCMYCRDTGDLATEHISGLSRLKSYYAEHA